MTSGAGYGATGKQPYNTSTLEQPIASPSEQGATMPYTLDTKVGEILNDTHAVKILEKYAPGVANNPMLALAGGMTLRTILAMPQAKQAGLTEEMVEKVLTEINALKK
jgi:hypothetical protein